MSEFKAGDVVRLKSGGPAMTVTRVAGDPALRGIPEGPEGQVGDLTLTAPPPVIPAGSVAATYYVPERGWFVERVFPVVCLASSGPYPTLTADDVKRLLDRGPIARMPDGNREYVAGPVVPVSPGGTGVVTSVEAAAPNPDAEPDRRRILAVQNGLCESGWHEFSVAKPHVVVERNK